MPTDIPQDRARAAVEELANTRMDLSLERWGELSSVILAALASPPSSDGLREARITEGQSKSLHNALVASCDSLSPPSTDAVALREALAWYGEQARLARLIHGEGDAGRQALSEDGGKRARQALSAEIGER